MTFDLFGFSGPWFIGLPAGWFGYGLAAAYGLALIIGLWWSFPGWRRLGFWQWLAFLGLSLAGLLVSQFLVLRLPFEILPPPNVPVEPEPPGLALLALLPTFLAAGGLGAGPAMVVGLITGFGRAGWETYSLLTPGEYAILGGLVAWCVRQDYRGWIAAWLRRPLVAGLIAGAVLWPLLFLSAFAYTNVGLAALDYVISLVLAEAPVFILQAAAAGLAVELIRLVVPGVWIRLRGTQPPPWLYSLNRKFLFALVPLFLFGLVGLSLANLTIAVDVSRNLILRQMERAAENAGRDIPLFIYTGNSLLLEIASSQDWLAQDSLTQTAGLLQSMRALAFFKQLTLLDDDLTAVATAGETLGLNDSPPLDDAQRRLAGQSLSGIPLNATVFVPLEGGGTIVDVVFFMPVTEPTTGLRRGVLVGWANLESNPQMQSVFNNLNGLAEGAGFIVGEDGLIIYHPDAAQIRQPFALEETAARLETQLARATAVRDRAPDGSQRLVLYYPLTGHPWTVVLTVPNSVVQGLSGQIALPVIGFLSLAGLLALAMVSAIALRLARPAEALSEAARRISDNQLDEPVRIDSEDEIGRAGAAFEDMRQRLRARLNELNLLLAISKGVSSSLDLNIALPTILKGALTATNASGGRIVLLPARGSIMGTAAHPYMTFADGPQAAVMAVLDRGVLDLTRSEARAAVIENLARAKAVLDVTPVAGKLSALVAMPLRQETMFYGALWLGYDRPHTFTESEINFLTTLAGQVSVAIANLRLFDAAEQERRRLSAILSSTPDGIVVTDPHHRILLLNPAAEAAFELLGTPVVGRLAAEVLPNRELAQLIQGPRDTNTGEYQTAAGRTLYAALSPIAGEDGEAIGRVCVLRDVTHFKELDLMKSDFVATVSHDLRAPLTFMRGYTTMMPMVGQLNDKQKEFVDKIIAGIEQMTKLIDDLLDLGRVEAGVGLAKEPCRLDDLVHNVMDSLSPVAANKGLTLTVEVPPDLPLIAGDPTLLRQAVANLVDNALKYTPQGGQVRLRVTTDDGKFCVAVSDTGVGVAPADQAHLFEKFFRVKQRGSTYVKGSGLGLAIVKSIVERHGGRVWMESKLGKGSTFYMEVPRDSAVAEIRN